MRGQFVMNYDYNKLFNSCRIKETTIKRPANIDEYYSDRSRIIYCSSFRRLLQKAQVFSLEPNASVRTRLTHSLEVADLGRTLANRIGYKLKSKKRFTDTYIQILVAIVENSCLLHDIGNPPFGHFGEAAIQDWAKNRVNHCVPSEVEKKSELFALLMKDFSEFDGNPQGFRTMTKLHTERDEFSLNLTYSTLLCSLKYSRAAGEEKGQGILKKAGYFQSEKDLVEKIYKDSGLELHHRYPFTYIMEAADDIAYCMSDIADGIEKKLITVSKFIDCFKAEWKNKYGDKEIPVSLDSNKKTYNFNHDISIPWSKKAMDEAIENFFKYEEEVYNGTANSLISENDSMGCVLETIKSVSRQELYTSLEAENIELTGYAVITGILQRYERLLSLSCSDFQRLVKNEKIDGLDVERRLYNRIGKRYIMAYTYAIEKLNFNSFDFKIREWWLRVHLIIDHISGMTDEFALQTYQMLEGINLLRM